MNNMIILPIIRPEDTFVDKPYHDPNIPATNMIPTTQRSHPRAVDLK